MSGEYLNGWVSRRRFLGLSAAAAGTILGARAVTWTASDAMGLARGAMGGASQGLDSLDFYPGQVLVTFNEPIFFRADPEQTRLKKVENTVTSRLHQLLQSNTTWSGYQLSLKAVKTWWVDGSKCPTVVLYQLVPSSAVAQPSEDSWLQQTLLTVTLLQLHATKLVCNACPNWTVTAASDGFIHGGPGGPPGSASPRKSYAFSATFPTVSNPLHIPVYVLDTFPMWLVRQPNKSALPPNVAQYNQQLLKQIGVQFNIQDQVNPQDPYQLFTGRQYCSCTPTTQPSRQIMENHGLFAASLIHQNYQSGPIYMVRVLNDYGAGTLHQLLDGLQAVKTPAVVNMSLVVSAKLISQHYLDQYGIKSTVLGKNLPCLSADHKQACTLYKDWAAATGSLHDMLRNLSSHAILVSAAGNDGYKWPNGGACGAGITPDMEAHPRVPARFDDVVISVAAVDSAGNPASYSNLAAATGATNGIATYGGEVCGKSDGIVGAFAIPASGKAVLSYNFWAGTSFSTPLMSGAFARLAAAGISGNPSTLINNLLSYFPSSAKQMVPALNCYRVLPQ
jgi:hypothetical protein